MLTKMHVSLHPLLSELTSPIDVCRVYLENACPDREDIVDICCPELCLCTNKGSRTGVSADYLLDHVLLLSAMSVFNPLISEEKPLLGPCNAAFVVVYWNPLLISECHPFPLSLLDSLV
jgi:hypothetical protein